MRRNLKNSCGRADLAWLLAEAGDGPQQEAWLDICGFEREEPKEKEHPEDDGAAGAAYGDREPLPRRNQTAIKEKEPKAELAFWRVTRIDVRDEQEVRKVPEWFKKAQPITRADLAGKNEEEDLPLPLLTPWSRLWPFLRRALSVIRERGPLDTDKLVRDIAHLRPIARLPRRPVRRWARTIHAILDTSDALAPFYDDMEELVTRLRTICGKHRLSVFVHPSGLDEAGYRIGGDEPPALYRAEERDVSVLALSDLGAYSGSADTVRWVKELGEHIRRNGGSATALMPCPPRRWPHRLDGAWRMVWWDLGQKLAWKRGRDVKRITSGTIARAGDPRQEKQGQEQLLCLLSPVVKLDRDLPRRARCLLHEQRTDAGMESDIWTGRLDPRQKLGEFEKCEEQLAESLAELLRRLHADFPEILAEELTTISYSLGKEQTLDDETQELNANITFSLDQDRWRDQGFSEDEFLGYLRRREARLPGWTYRDHKVAASWVMMHLDDQGKLNTDELPAELSYADVAWVLKKNKLPAVYNISQIGNRLINPVAFVNDDDGVSYLGTIETNTSELAVGSWPEGNKVLWRPRDPGPELFTHRYETRVLEIESPLATMRLEQMRKPTWASEMGRDISGLYVIHRDGRKFYWLNSGRRLFSIPRERKKEKSPTRDLEVGCWVSEAIYREQLSTRHKPPSLAGVNRLIEDKYGLYEEMWVFGQPVRFRWIEQGIFLMGSPEDEPERTDRETQHEVELTQGFWLADTACTQALWQAVMDGENPSNFKGEKRPVENVSYQDCERFIERINREVPGLQLCLPTEAQWEYACRAGTDTPFHFGKNITPDNVNYNGNYPYAGGKKGLDRKKTVEVQSFPPNDWGLYEMHMAMCWSGVGTGMESIRRAGRSIPRGPEKARPVFCAAAPGSPAPGPAGRLPGASFARAAAPSISASASPEVKTVELRRREKRSQVARGRRSLSGAETERTRAGQSQMILNLLRKNCLALDFSLAGDGVQSPTLYFFSFQS